MAGLNLQITGIGPVNDNARVVIFTPGGLVHTSLRGILGLLPQVYVDAEDADKLKVRFPDGTTKTFVTE